MGTGAEKSQGWAKSNGEGGIRQPDQQGKGDGGGGVILNEVLKQSPLLTLGLAVKGRV